MVEYDKETAFNDKEAIKEHTRKQQEVVNKYHGKQYEIERDAARYRWMRERDIYASFGDIMFIGHMPETQILSQEKLDKIIDKAMLLEGWEAE